MIIKVLRSKTFKAIDARVRTLKVQVAKRIGVAVKSTRATSTAIKRLIAKRRKIAGSKKLAAFVRHCSTLKLSSYKNPKSTGSVGRNTTRRTTSRGRTYSTTGTTGSRSVTTKYKNQTKTLKKEIQKLKQRNSFMKRQVAKFRKEVTQMQSHYGKLKSKTTPWRVVKSKKVTKDVSNIVRFSNALHNAFSGKQQRKAG